MTLRLAIGLIFIPILVGSCAAVTLGQDPVKIPEDPDNFHLFLLVGQSNMAGRGQVGAEDRQPHPRVLTFDKQCQWVPAVDPLHFDKPGIAGVGLGKTFGIDYAEANEEVTVGLIPCAVGGSPIAAWEPAGYHPQTDSHPYDQAMDRAKMAVQVGTLKGILWHQGESDARQGLAEVYEQKLHELVHRFRQELNAANTPFIVGQMGHFQERPWSDAKRLVDRVHQDLPQAVSRTAFVSSQGLSHKGDGVHFDAASYRQLGHCYFQAYQKLTEE